jgi:hypothetical protein
MFVKGYTNKHSEKRVEVLMSHEEARVLAKGDLAEYRERLRIAVPELMIGIEESTALVTGEETRLEAVPATA